MSLKQKFFAAMAVPVVVVLVALGLSHLTEAHADEQSELVLNSFEVRAAIDRVLEDIVNAETGTRGYLLTGRLEFLTPYAGAATRIADDIEALANLVRSNPTQAARLQELRPILIERFEWLRQTQRMTPITNKNREEVADLLTSGRIVMRDIRLAIEEMRTEEERVFAERQAAFAEADRTASLVRLAVLPLALLVAIALVVYTTERIVHRIRRIEENARRLEAGEPMLENDRSSDELGRLARRMVWTGTQLTQLQEELRHMATLDPLTGLANRRGFIPLAEQHLALAARERRTLALMFVDVDGLKGVNDRFGHAAGDELLREAAILLQETFRHSDVPARMGGDEFCVLLNAPTALDVPAAVGRLRAAETRANARSGRRYPLSLSVGVAELPLMPDGTTIDDLIAAADERMYEDKRRRREGAPAATPA
jgi:diguanylate cyclase (GGDEF)-like protein